MAGAGYKLFNTGDVLTAAQVNTYLMEQTVMVFADAAARTTALTGVVSEGMLSYLKDTNAVEVYNGSAWVSSDDPNAIQNTIVDAKGDLITATAADTPARLAAGNNGETLVADSSSSVGLRWNPSPSVANPIINGAYDIAQRGTSFTTAGGFAYTLDRWISRTAGVGGSMVTTRETTGDTTNLPFIQYCARVRRTTSNSDTNNLELEQPIETTNSIPFVGRQVTFSFYARKSANFTGTLTALLVSGTGTDQGLPVTFTGVATVSSLLATLTTTWTRYTLTGTPSASATQLGIIFRHTPSGTAGADDYYEVTGVQIDLGAVALPFRRSGGTIQGELAACQRYFQKSYSQGTAPASVTSTSSVAYQVPTAGTGSMHAHVRLPVNMRTAPTVTLYDQNGTSGNVYKGANGKAADTFYIGESGFAGGTTDATSATLLVFQFTASAEL